MVGISSRVLAGFGKRKYASFQTAMDPVYDVRGRPPAYHHQIVFFLINELQLQKFFLYLKRCFNVLFRVNLYGLMDKTLVFFKVRDCGLIPDKDPII